MAEAHVLALEKEKAGGERIAAVKDTQVWQDLREWLLTVPAKWSLIASIFYCLVDVANQLKGPERKVSVGFPDIDRNPKSLKISSTKATDILGIKYRSLEDTTRHMFEDFTRRGF